MNGDYQVLVAEDHPAIRKQLEFILARAGFAVTTRERTQSARAHAPAILPDRSDRLDDA